MDINYPNSDECFADQDELLDSFEDILDLHIYYLYKYHPWASPDSSLQNIPGNSISRAEFEHSLVSTSDSTAYCSLTEEEISELVDARKNFIGRFQASVDKRVDCPLIRIGVMFELDFFQLAVILTLFCYELNTKYEKLFAFLQDNIAKRFVTVETVIRLWAFPGDRILKYFSAFSENFALVKFLCVCDNGTLSGRTLFLSKAVTDYFYGNSTGYEYFIPTDDIPPIYINKPLVDFAVNSVKAAREQKTTLLYISGRHGSGRHFLVKHCAAELSESVMFISAKLLCGEANAAQVWSSAVCRSILENCALCITDFEVLLEENNRTKLADISSAICENCGRWISHIYIISEKKWYDARLGADIIKQEIEIGDTDESRRLILWERFMESLDVDGDISPGELAAKFRFTPGQIFAAATCAAELARIRQERTISSETLHRACYDQAVSGLSSLASQIKPAYDWDDLVLPEYEKNMLKQSCAYMKYRHTVYNEWGFESKAAYGRGLSVLFSGPPGTGKTMAAQVIANQLHMRLYKIQLSQIVSKYIGETEKNLSRVFSDAKNADCILFFDETDALFGKRSEVKDSHDRHANIETAYLLQQMEDYDGVVLMATNLLGNIDEAFMRRINFIVSFPFPDEDTRKLLWKKMLDVKAPVENGVDFDFLAKRFPLSGGNIKNCVIGAAFIAAAENSPIGMKHLLTGIIREQKKNNAVILKEDLREYADLVSEL